MTPDIEEEKQIESSASESSIISTQDDGSKVVNGSLLVDGNLNVSGQTTTAGLKVVEEGSSTPLLTTNGRTVKFRKAVEFQNPVEFSNGKTIIGIETTYDSAYVGTQTLQAGQRIVVGDSSMKIEADERSITADTYQMTLKRLLADNVFAKKTTTDLLAAKDAKVTGELIAQNVFADTIKTNKFYIESITGMKLQTSESIKTKDLIVGGSAKVQNDITIMGIGVNGAALTVNGGEIVANKGIVSHTRNNRFQCMEIMGSGKSHDVCFRIDKNVDSLIEGDVTIQDAKLILDNTKLVSDEILVIPLEYSGSDDITSGIQMTTNPNWSTYQDSMVQEVEAEEGAESSEEYDPYASVEEAQERTTANYESIQEAVKDILNPISYLMEHGNPNCPKQFSIKQGLHRIDHNGNALFKNIVSENARFSRLSAYDLKVNRFSTDKLNVTSLAANVVDTDNLLKSRAIAEFDGVVNTSADVFVEKDSKVNVAEGAKVTFQSGSSLELKNGAEFKMGSDSSIRLSGDIQLDLNKLVFFDSKTNRRYRISFRDAEGIEGLPGETVMEYERLSDEEAAGSSAEEIVGNTETSALDLERKLKSLGV